MFIRRTELKDLPLIEQIYAGARAFMKLNGNGGQWGGVYPKRETLLEDIGQGRSYVCVEGDDILAVFCFMAGPDRTYSRIDDGAWLNEKPYFVIHRLASSGKKGGVGGYCINWCFEHFSNIRIDTHENNRPMLNLIKSSGFSYCGIIYTDDGTARLAFQKDISAK